MSNYIRIEPLEEDELAFIQKRYDKESKEYMFAMNMLLKAVVIIPFIVGFIYYLRYEQTDLMIKSFCYALCITTIFFAIAGFASYRRNLFAIKKDVTEKTKTIESCLITEKKYMALNNTWHFYLTSLIKYSIEVSEEDFHRFDVNNEINIEYASRSKIYFGYF